MILLITQIVTCIFSSRFNCVLFQVFFGRPMIWGLVHSGEKGAREILELMRREIDLAFALTGKLKHNFLHQHTYLLIDSAKVLKNECFFLGCASVKDVTQDMVIHASYYSHLWKFYISILTDIIYKYVYDISERYRQNFSFYWKFYVTKKYVIH